MIKKINRFSGRGKFLEVKSLGSVVFNSPLFGVLVLKKTDNEIKFGWIISKKVSKKAVERNKIKRRLNQILETKLDKFKVGTRIIFLIKKEIKDKTKEEIEIEINKLIEKLKD